MDKQLHSTTLHELKQKVEIDTQSIRYPVLNVAFTTRVGGDRVKDRAALLKYTHPITSSIQEYNNENMVNANHLTKIQQEDGMIFSFREMFNQKQKFFTDAENKTHFYGPKILICVCMYNQGIDAINLTLGGIYNNLQSLQAQGISSEQVAVVLVQDGILKLLENQKRKEYSKGNLSILEFYKKLDQSLGKEYCDLEDRIDVILDSMEQFGRKKQDNLISKNGNLPPNIQKNISLLYQNQWWPYLTETNTEDKQKLPPKPKKKLKLFSCFKHLNGKKLSSHLWFFEGFCRYLKPEFIVLLDVGTKPASTESLDPDSYNGLTNLIKGFYHDKNTGGVTGLMSIDCQFPSLESAHDDSEKPNPFQSCFLSIQKAQQYEYIFAHFLDKNFQSATGFLHVLPGAWSAYRYIALIKSDKYEQNLLEKSYFKPILHPEGGQDSLQVSNMYLAEDRILSLGIFCQKGSEYTLKYCPDAVAYTDPMKTHTTLIGQRRRWINSSLFAFLYVLDNYYFHVHESKHNCIRANIMINISMAFAGLSFVNAYITPAVYFFVLYITISQIDNTNTIMADIATIVSTIYCFILIGAVGGSLIGKQWQQPSRIVSAILSLFTFSMFALVLYNVFGIYLDLDNIDMNSFKSASVVYMLFINLGSFIILLIIHLFTHTKFVFKLLRDTISYMAYQGAYSQTMVIYGMCNVDDVSWGTKGAVGSGGVSKYFETKVYFVSTWQIFLFIMFRLVFNCLLAYLFIYIDLIVPQRQGKQGGTVLLAIVLYSTFIIGTKSLMATLYFLYWVLTQKICCIKVDVPDNNVIQVQKFWKDQNKKFKDLTSKNEKQRNLDE